jgi:hypothetical protein
MGPGAWSNSNGYLASMFLLDMGEECCIAEIAFLASADKPSLFFLTFLGQ